MFDTEPNADELVLAELVEEPGETYAPTPNDMIYWPVLRELDRLQNRKSSWGNTLGVLIVSVLLFVGLTKDAGSGLSLLLLIGVLFFHELGHLVAMWFFRYRNLRMFFIPFLGAAVSGQNYNVPGWKKATVSLMGPLPGIAAGIVAGGAALMLDWPVVLQASTLALLLNGFNLLPVLPLDGGWAMHAILFSRHPVLDVGFRFLAALALCASGWLGLTFLAIVGVMMLFGLPAAYRVAQAVSRLRQRGLDTASPDAQTIPPGTARAIIDEIWAANPAKHDVRTTAQFTLQAFELLNARPPGWLVTSVLGLVHGMALLAAIVFGVLFILGPRVNPGQFP